MKDQKAVLVCVKCYSQPRPLQVWDWVPALHRLQTDVFGATRGASIGHVSPEAAAGGVIALIEDDDIVDINITERKLDVRVSEQELAERKKRWKAPEKELTGYIKRYAQHVTSGSRGAVFEK